jgi:hypothetical protein
MRPCQRSAVSTHLCCGPAAQDGNDRKRPSVPNVKFALVLTPLSATSTRWMWERLMDGRLAALDLNEAERVELTALASRRRTAQALAPAGSDRARLRGGERNKEVAGRLGVDPTTVSKWRRRFLADRLDGLLDEPRPGAPRTSLRPHRGGDHAKPRLSHGRVGFQAGRRSGDAACAARPVASRRGSKIIRLAALKGPLSFQQRMPHRTGSAWQLAEIFFLATLERRAREGVKPARRQASSAVLPLSLRL